MATPKTMYGQLSNAIPDEDHKDARKDLTMPWHCSFSHVTCPPGFAAGAWLGNSAASRCHLQRKRRAKPDGHESTAPNL